MRGTETPVWSRGEVVGTRVQYDNRLLMFMIARLDRRQVALPAQAVPLVRVDDRLANALETLVEEPDDAAVAAHRETQCAVRPAAAGAMIDAPLPAVLDAAGEIAQTSFLCEHREHGRAGRRGRRPASRPTKPSPS